MPNIAIGSCPTFRGAEMTPCIKPITNPPPRAENVALQNHHHQSFVASPQVTFISLFVSKSFFIKNMDVNSAQTNPVAEPNIAIVSCSGSTFRRAKMPATTPLSTHPATKNANVALQPHHHQSFVASPQVTFISSAWLVSFITPPPVTVPTENSLLKFWRSCLLWEETTGVLCSQT